ncbi:MAG: caspase family protein [Streptosporangiaceae bacterium]
MDGQRRALIIANDEYEQGTLQNLRAPSADAEALGRVLGDPQIGEFAVQVVHNQPSYVIQSQIEEMFSESRPDDVLLLHFSGHGLKSESGELFSPPLTPARTGSAPRPSRRTSCGAACGTAGRTASCCCWTAATGVPSPRASRCARPGMSTCWTASRGKEQAAGAAGR